MLFAFILIKPWSIILVFFIPAPAIIYAAFRRLQHLDGQARWRPHQPHLAGAAFGVIFMLAMQPSIFTHLRELSNPTFRLGGG